MTPEQSNKLVDDLALDDNFHAPDKVIVEGQTADYVWYQKKMIEKRMDELQRLIVRTIDTLQARSDERLNVIGNLLRENKSLRDKLKEQIK
jgi:hypothetical protein